MIPALNDLKSSEERVFTAPWVPMGIKIGVRTFPWAVDISPTLEFSSFPVNLKEKFAN